MPQLPIKLSTEITNWYYARVGPEGVTGPTGPEGPTGPTGATPTVAGDHGTASIDQINNVCYGTGATPPTASTTTEGAVYFQYTA